MLTSMVRAAIVFFCIFLIDVTNSSDPSASRANCFLNIRFNISAFYDEPIDCSNLTDLPENAIYSDLHLLQVYIQHKFGEEL